MTTLPQLLCGWYSVFPSSQAGIQFLYWHGEPLCSPCHESKNSACVSSLAIGCWHFCFPVIISLEEGISVSHMQDYREIWEEFNTSSMRTNTQLGISRKTKPNPNKHQALSIAFLLLPCIYSYGENKFKFPGMGYCGCL